MPRNAALQTRPTHLWQNAALSRLVFRGLRARPLKVAHGPVAELAGAPGSGPAALRMLERL